MEPGERIKNKRLELELSQEYIADQLGVSGEAVPIWVLAFIFLMVIFVIIAARLTEVKREKREKK